jgi:riboflavin biosynthesis pyrimidine reductase
VTIASLAQRTLFHDAARIALELPLGEVLGALHPGGTFPLVRDPRGASRACIVGMMVLRPASTHWAGLRDGVTLGDSLREVQDWCYDVSGVGGSWPVSGGNALDAYRLALQYGTVDAVLAGAATIAREGVVAGARRAHLWQPYAPLSWAPLAPHRDVLEPAISAVRRTWQQLGVLSARKHPAQVAISASGRPSPSGVDLLDARIFRERHPDGSAIEGYVQTSEAGAERMRERARAKGLRADTTMIVVSPADDPEAVDVARVPEVLRERLDARLVEHDGGAIALRAFLDAGAVAQLNLTLMKGRSVRDVIASSPRLSETERSDVLSSWDGRARLFELRPEWPPLSAIEQEGGEALVVSLASGSGRGSTPNRCG